VTGICHKLGVSQASFYTWKKQYAAMGVKEMRELRQFREHQAEAASGGSEFGPPDAAGDRLKRGRKIGPAMRADAVGYPLGEARTRACQRIIPKTRLSVRPERRPHIGEPVLWGWCRQPGTGA